MKKTLAILLSISALFLTGCSFDKNSSTNNSNTSSEVTDTDNSDNTSSNNTDKKDDDLKKEDTTSNKIDNIENKNNSTSNNSASENSTIENKASTTISIFVPNSNADGLNEKKISINHLTAYSIVNALVENNIVTSGTKALNFEYKNNIGYLDVSSNIYNINSGSAGEILMLDSIRETFLKAFNLQKIKLTVNGNPYEGHHVQYGTDDYL